jgi:SAM-dependent methyltransferase
MKQMWDERYSLAEYVYGIEANVFFKEQLEKLSLGKILLPGEGEGRNAVYAARMGWDVLAYDPSIEGKKKALKLAEKTGVNIQYEIGSYQEFSPEPMTVDVVGLFFTHQPSEMRHKFHQSLKNSLKPRGVVILEGFSKEQVNRNTGGPKDLNFLFSEDELRKDFSYLKELEITEKVRTLDEGPFHQGEAAVIQLVGRL